MGLSKKILFLFFIVIFSTFKSYSHIITRNDVKHFSYGFIIANLLKSFINNNNLENSKKNILSLISLGAYAKYIHTISPYGFQDRNMLATIGGMSLGTASKGGLSNFVVNLFVAYITLGLVNCLID